MYKLGLCHQLELSLSIANEIECFCSATRSLQTLHDAGLLSLQKVSSVPRNMVPQVAFAEMSAYGATSKVAGYRKSTREELSSAVDVSSSKSRASSPTPDHLRDVCVHSSVGRTLNS